MALTLLGFIAVPSRGDVDGGRGTYCAGEVPALGVVAACGDALRPSNKAGALEGSSREFGTEHPVVLRQAGELRVSLVVIASTRLALVEEMSGRVAEAVEPELIF